jgi:hypothetical protein
LASGVWKQQNKKLRSYSLLVGTLCNSERTRCFGGTYRLHLQGRRGSQARNQQTQKFNDIFQGAQLNNYEKRMLKAFSIYKEQLITGGIQCHKEKFAAIENSFSLPASMFCAFT